MAQNGDEGIKDLQQLLQVDNVNSAVRIGDIYSLLIEYNANRQRWKQAYSYLQEMRESISEQSIKYYVNPNVIMAIHRELNIEYKMPQPTQRRDDQFRSSVQGNRQENDDDDEIRDTVDYGTYDD